MSAAPSPDAGRSGTTRVVAIVLNWNGGEETVECLRSLAAQQAPRPTVLLADNASSDGSVERLLALDPGLAVLRFEQNLGYAGGNNRAMRHAFGKLSAQWVCLVNSDLVAPPDLFARLFEAVESLQAQGGPPVGALGPRILYRDRPEVVWACGGRIGPTVNVTRLLEHGKPAASCGGPPLATDYVPGTCLLVSRAAWEVVGELDESFFCYLEDADWCVRMRRRGFGVFVAPEASAYHALSTSTGGGYSAGRKYMTAVNSVHFLRKHGTWRGWTALFVFDLALWPLAMLAGMVSGRGRAALAKLRGVIDGLRGEHVDAAVAARYARRPS